MYINAIRIYKYTENTHKHAHTLSPFLCPFQAHSERETKKESG